MPHYRQPDSLADLAVNSIGNFICRLGQQLLGTNLCPESDKYEVMDSLHLSENDDRNKLRSHHPHILKANLQNMFFLQQFLYSNLPPVLANKVASYLLSVVINLSKELECPYYPFENVNCDTCLSAIESLADATMNPDMSELVLFNYPNYMCHILCKKLCKLTKLSVLKLYPISTRSVKLVVRDLVTRSVGSLKNLVVFTYEKNCTDSVLEVMSQNCMLLEYLTLTFSKKVTGHSVNSIKRFQYLKSLDIWGTFIPGIDCVQLLNSIPDLENFSSDQDFMQDVTKSTMKLSSLTIANLDSPQKLVNTYPYITQITIFAVHCELSPLAGLIKLQNLEIGNCDFSVIENLLSCSGKHLTSLKVKEVADVNMKFISFCTQLKTLSLSVCSYIHDNDGSIVFGDLASLHFNNLENLYIRGYYFRGFDVFVSAYNNLKFLNLSLVPVLTNDMIVNATLTNTFRKLEVVSFDDCGQIKVETLKCLINCCCNLKRIVCKRIDNQEQDELMEFYNLKKYLKQNNFDITLII